MMYGNGPVQDVLVTSRVYRILCVFSMALAFTVIVLGAFTRLTDAGLGCPDWPGCYGQLWVPEQHVAADVYPEQVIEAKKAWTEMIHRYFASGLGLLIVIIAGMSWHKRHIAKHPFYLPMCLVGLVIAQGLLGMWTVTLKLHPTVVMSHLLGGLTTLALLTLLTLRAYFSNKAMCGAVPLRGLSRWALVGLVVLAIQIALGGWTSSNYAALACPDFPTCQDQWLPPLDFKQAFHLTPSIGLNYDGGLLHNTPRVTIHVMHRLGALYTTFILLLLSMQLYRYRRHQPIFTYLAGAIIGLLVIQVGLGITNVLAWLPLSVAVAHNAVAALLLVTMVASNFFIYRSAT